jgi:serine protease AprX
VTEVTGRYAVTGGVRCENTDSMSRLISKVGGTNTTCAPLSKQIFATLTDRNAAKLRGIGLKVTPVRAVSLDIVTTPSPIVGSAEYAPGDMLDLLGLNEFKFSITPPMFGEGYNVAVIDTGIRSSHQLLGNRVVYYRNFAGGSDGDGFDHGTGVASVIHAVVPEAGILDMKALDSSGVGTEENVVLALEECASLQSTRPDISPNIINMSVGSPDDGNPDNPIRLACQAVMALGMVIVAAAGNNGQVEAAITIPACEQYVVAVGSMTVDPFAVSEFSSRGPTRGGLTKPDVVFLGENIVLASSASDIATVAKSGTSFATPLTTGVIVLTMEGVVRTQDPPADSYVGKNILTSTVVIDDMLPTVCFKPEGIPTAKDNDYGYGVPVGSLMFEGAGGFIDINASINLTVMMLMIQMMAVMSDNITSKPPNNSVARRR